MFSDVDVYATSSATISAASCVASSVQATLPPLAWSVSAEGCALEKLTTCEQTLVCGPAFAGFQACIYQSGNGSCPSGAYSTKTLVYSATSSDSRGCTPCTCGAAAGATCTGGSFSANTSGCSGGATFPMSSTCSTAFLQVNEGATISIQLTQTPIASDATCYPDGGQPSGTVTATSPITVCCP
jgi:hypothetical protein